jgi:hypothetical protein|tara:strand:- start:1483 stop:1734 length:252 start_codon:yes stop_codon:yes gene_type:complete
MTATKGKGRGKTKGATSFVTISLNALNEVLKPTASVMVSRKFVEALGLSGNKVASNSTTVNAVKQENVFVKNDKEEKDALVDF